MALGPGREPVAAVNLILVEQVSQPRGQLQTALGIFGRAIGAQEAGDRLERRPIAVLAGQLRQQPHQAPDQRCFVEGRTLRHRCGTQHLAVAAPQEARRQFDSGCGADASVLRQRHLQPLGRAVALYQQDLGFKRRQRAPGEPVEHRVAQSFESVAVQHHQAGFDVARHATGDSYIETAAARRRRMAATSSGGSSTRTCSPWRSRSISNSVSST